MTEQPAPSGETPIAPVVEATPAEDARADDPPVAETGAVQLDDVVVTATKREKSLRDIPASIDAFNGAELEAKGQLSAADFIERSPGVTISAGAPTIMKVTIRGINTDTKPGGDIPPTTGVFIGDTAFTDPYFASIQPDLSAFDLESVEILKGPQGTLFGGSALAGALRYVLREPVGKWEARGFSQFIAPEGGSQAWTHGVAVNLPVVEDSLALRLGYINREYPGLTDVTRDPRRENVDASSGEQLRGIATWLPTDASKVKLTHLSQDFEAPDANYYNCCLDRRETDKFVLKQPAASEFVLDSLEASYDFTDMRLVSLTSRTTKHLNALVDLTSGFLPTPNGFPPELAIVTTIDHESEAWAQELRLQSTGTDSLQWLAGLYWYRYDYALDLVIDTLLHQSLEPALNLEFLRSLGLGAVLDLLPPEVLGLYDATTLATTIGRTRTTERALFFDISDTFWDRLELSVGARLYETGVEGGFTGDGLLVRLGNSLMPFDARGNNLKEKGVSPKFAAVYKLTPRHAIYALASRGFRFGGVQSTPPTVTTQVPRTYKSDSLWNYELGLRTSWFNNTLRFDVTGFYIDYKNPLLAQKTNDALQLTYFDNVGAAVSRGVEASLRWSTPVRGLVLDLDGALTDAHITEPFTAADGTVVQAGAQMPGAAESQYSATLSHLMPVGPINVGSSVNYTYVGKGYNDIVHSFRINDYGTLNASLIFSNYTWSLRPNLSFNVTNITDEIAPKGGHVASTVGYGVLPLYVLSPPRTFMVRLGLEF